MQCRAPQAINKMQIVPLGQHCPLQCPILHSAAMADHCHRPQWPSPPVSGTKTAFILPAPYLVEMKRLQYSLAAAPQCAIVQAKIKCVQPLMTGQNNAVCTQLCRMFSMWLLTALYWLYLILPWQRSSIRPL